MKLIELRVANSKKYNEHSDNFYQEYYSKIDLHRTGLNSA